MSEFWSIFVIAIIGIINISTIVFIVTFMVKSYNRRKEFNSWIRVMETTIATARGKQDD